MAQGDVTSALASISANGTYDIRPAGTEEAVIHNVYHSDTIALGWFDNATEIRFDWAQGTGVYAKYQFHVNNNRYLRLLNSISAVRFVGYDGVVSKA